MKRYKYFIYGNATGIDNVIKDLKNYKGLRFETLGEVFNFIADNSEGIRKIDLSLKPYSFDERINKFVFMIVTNRFGKENFIKKYGCSQFAGYFLIEL